MHTVVLASSLTDEAPFVAWGSSHVAVLMLTLVGVVGMVVLARRGAAPALRRTEVVLAVALVVTTAAYQVYAFEPGRAGQTLPLWLSDLVPYVAAGALWSGWSGAGRRWAVGATYYWGLTLTPQALLTPALSGPDFPSIPFLAFFAAHVLPVWAAVLLVARGGRPGWAEYRVTVVATVAWAVVAQVLNLLTGANYGYLDRKPDTASVLDLFGPWPWYLLVEALVVLAVWAAMTASWSRTAGPRPAPDPGVVHEQA